MVHGKRLQHTSEFAAERLQGRSFGSREQLCQMQGHWLNPLNRGRRPASNSTSELTSSKKCLNFTYLELYKSNEEKWVMGRSSLTSSVNRMF